MRPVVALAALAVSLMALTGCSYEHHDHYPPRVEQRTVYVPAYRTHDYHGYREYHHRDRYRRDCN